MKKYNLLKVMLITIAVFVLMSWIIPASVFSDGQFVSNGHEPIGLFSILMAPFRFFDYAFSSAYLYIDNNVEIFSYSSIVLALLSIGIFYKVLNKTGAYGKLVEDIVKKLKDRKEVFVVISTIFFAVLSSLTGLSLLLFALIPFFITVLLKLKYSRLTALGATVLALLVGRIAAIGAHDLTGISNKMFELKFSDDLAMKVVLLIVLTGILIFYVLRAKSSSNDSEEDPLYDGVVKKEKSYAPLLFLTFIFFLIMGVCMYNWYYVFNNTAITEAYENLMSSSVASYPVAQNIFGMMEPFGYWTGFTMSAILLLLSLIIGFIYSLTFEDIIDSVKTGISAMGRVSIYVVLAFTIMLFIYGTEYNVLQTIVGWIYNTFAKAAIPFAILASIVYGFFINDFFAISSQLSLLLVSNFSESELSLSVLAMQVISGTMALIAPTSVFLIAGLAYLEIPYKKWFVYIWKLFSILLIVCILLLLIISII